MQQRADAIQQKELEDFKLQQQLGRQKLISQLQQEQQGQSPDASFQTCSSQGDGGEEMREVEVEEVTSIERACSSA